jgi:hypothetical protein
LSLQLRHECDTRKTVIPQVTAFSDWSAEISFDQDFPVPDAIHDFPLHRFTTELAGAVQRRAFEVGINDQYRAGAERLATHDCRRYRGVAGYR